MHELIPAATSRLDSRIRQAVPLVEHAAQAWLNSLSRGRPLAEYFAPDWGFPLFQLPQVLEALVTSRSDARFRADLTYSTVNGYLFIRLIDDVADGDRNANPSLLPLSAFFHYEFERPYHDYFDQAHPFWAVFEEHWFNCHSRTIVDQTLTDIDLRLFRSISAQKTCAAKIPLFATGFYYDAPKMAERFCQIAEIFGYYVQLADDLFDWPTDSSNKTETFFLSEARRRSRPQESLTEWAGREGIEWAVGLCQGWLDDLTVHASELHSKELAALVQNRRVIFEQRTTLLRENLARVAPLADWFGGAR
jgi:hypothetical protein